MEQRTVDRKQIKGDRNCQREAIVRIEMDKVGLDEGALWEATRKQ